MMERRVLVIGLSWVLAQQLRHALRHPNLAIQIFNDGADTPAAAFDDLPDVIILGDDLLEPEHAALYEQLKHDPRTAHIPVIILTHQTSTYTPAVSPLGERDYKLSTHTFVLYTLVELLRSMQSG